jgi:hypothetical protein
MIVLGMALLVYATSGALARPQTTGSAGQRTDLVTDGVTDGRIKLMINRSVVVSTKTPYKRVSVGNPEIADVNTIGPSNILLTAKKPGNTQLIIWDDQDRSQVVEVNVDFDVVSLQDQLRKMFPGTSIEVSQLMARSRFRAAFQTCRWPSRRPPRVAVLAEGAELPDDLRHQAGDAASGASRSLAIRQQCTGRQLQLRERCLHRRQQCRTGESVESHVRFRNRRSDPPLNGVNLNGATAQ